jgi:hypothetical protein
MAQEEVLRIRINPDNRRVSVNDPSYQKAWTESFEKVRDEYEQQLKAQSESGELEVAIDASDPKVNTPERAIHFMAHSHAEAAMQDWAIKRGIGLIGVTGGYDHGQVIEYVDDSAVPFLEYKIEEAA